MNKVLIFYFSACLMMFVSLFAIFAALDLEKYILPPAEIVRDGEINNSISTEPPPFTLEEFAKADPRGIRFFKNGFPRLLTGYMYSVGAPVLLYDSLDFEEAFIETLSEGGIFQLQQILMQADSTRAYRVLVSDGRRNYEMYIREEMLPGTEFYGKRPSDSVIQMLEDRQIQFQESQETDARELRQAYEEALVVHREFEAKRHPKNPLIENLKELLARVSKISSNGLLVPGVLAGIATLLVAFFLGSVTWLRNTRVWERDLSFDDVDANERGADYFESEEEEEETENPDWEEERNNINDMFS